MQTLKGLGYHRLFLPPEAGGPEERLSALTQSLVLEELGWGSLGLATAFLVDMLPVICMSNFGSQELKDELMVPWVDDDTGSYHGCWAITEPDHGSDFISVRDSDKRSVLDVARRLVAQNFKLIATATSLSATSASTYGQSVTLTATVAPVPTVRLEVPGAAAQAAGRAGRGTRPEAFP